MVEEAVALTIQSAAIGRAGEVLILDMGEPVLIEDVAKMMASGSPRNIEIIYTGLRPGEKLHELLIGEGEIDDRPFHPEITQTLVPAISEDSLATLLAHEAPLSARPLMERACDLARPRARAASERPSRPVAEPAHAN
jgi:FlaA1/EpsC-like NDP-sugar epimerase